MKINMVRNKVAALGIMISLLLGAGFFPIVSATTIREVWPDGHGPYPTIQSAINAADPGDTILVHSGYYSEEITIDKSINLRGENPETTAIESDGDTLTIDANDVTVWRLTIQNSSEGIVLYGANNRIFGNIFRDNMEAIRVEAYYNPSDQNWIFENQFIGNYIGIALVYSGANYYPISNIQNNEFRQNDIGVAVGDFIGCSDNSIITKNNFIDNDLGIQIMGAYYNKVYENNFRNNDVGIYMSDGYYWYCEENRVYHNNFIEKTPTQKYAVDDTYYDNYWDNGASSGGNYWSDWANNSGYSQNIYIINGTGNGVDRYPFAQPNGWIPVPHGGKEKCTLAP